MARMIVTAALFALVALTMTGCFGALGGRFVRGTGEIVTLEQDFADFDALSISHAFEVIVSEGDGYELVLHVDAAVQPYLDVRQEGDTVTIGLQDGVSLGGFVTLEAEVTMPRLRALELSGASRAELDKFDSADDVALSASGASRIKGNLSCGNLALELSGASQAELDGAARDLQVEASGASQAKLGELPVEDADVRLSGASSATVDASGTLDASASGASTLYYLGEPRMGDIETSGASSVKRR